MTGVPRELATPVLEVCFWWDCPGCEVINTEPPVTGVSVEGTHTVTQPVWVTCMGCGGEYGVATL